MCAYFKRNYNFTDKFLVLKYASRIWIPNGVIDLNIPRTNNATEGRHRALNSTFFTTRVSLPLLIEKVKDEKDQIGIKYIRTSLYETLPRHNAYIVQENSLY